MYHVPCGDNKINRIHISFHTCKNVILLVQIAMVMLLLVVFVVFSSFSLMFMCCVSSWVSISVLQTSSELQNLAHIHTALAAANVHVEMDLMFKIKLSWHQMNMDLRLRASSRLLLIKFGNGKERKIVCAYACCSTHEVRKNHEISRKKLAHLAFVNLWFAVALVGKNVWTAKRWTVKKIGWMTENPFAC